MAARARAVCLRQRQRCRCLSVGGMHRLARRRPSSGPASRTRWAELNRKPDWLCDGPKKQLVGATGLCRAYNVSRHLGYTIGEDVALDHHLIRARPTCFQLVCLGDKRVREVEPNDLVKASCLCSGTPSPRKSTLRCSVVKRARAHCEGWLGGRPHEFERRPANGATNVEGSRLRH